MNVNKHERLSNIRHRLKEQLVVRKDMNVNKHERLEGTACKERIWM